MNWFVKYAQCSQPYAWLALRVIAGIMFAMHGAQKLFGFMGKDPASLTGGMGIFGVDVGINMIFVAGVIEFFGGLLLIVGLMTRWAAALSALLMVMAYTHVHLSWNPLASGGELAVLYFLVWLAVWAYGGGPYSLDAKWCPDTKAEIAAHKKAKKA